jgi:hypothetical protein
VERHALCARSPRGPKQDLTSAPGRAPTDLILALSVRALENPSRVPHIGRGLAFTMELLVTFPKHVGPQFASGKHRVR